MPKKRAAECLAIFSAAQHFAVGFSVTLTSGAQHHQAAGYRKRKPLRHRNQRHRTPGRRAAPAFTGRWWGL